jgi:hypothetical protein
MPRKQNNSSYATTRRRSSHRAIQPLGNRVPATRSSAIKRLTLSVLLLEAVYKATVRGQLRSQLGVAGHCNLLIPERI